MECEIIVTFPAPTAPITDKRPLTCSYSTVQDLWQHTTATYTPVISKLISFSSVLSRLWLHEADRPHILTKGAVLVGGEEGHTLKEPPSSACSDTCIHSTLHGHICSYTCGMVFNGRYKYFILHQQLLKCYFIVQQCSCMHNNNNNYMHTCIRDSATIASAPLCKHSTESSAT